MKRTTTKLYDTLLTMLAAFILISSLVLAALIFTDSFSVTAQAKTKKPYKTKTLKLVKGKKKIWYAGRRIKKVKKISKNKNFTVKIIDCRYSLRFTGTDRNTKQTVKVYYKNGRTQKFNLKTDVNYLNKIKAELKPMLANPDAGLKKALSDWEKRDCNGKKLTYEFRLFRSTMFTEQPKDPNAYPNYSESEMYEKLTTSQKKALILEAYVHSHSHYGDPGDDNCYYRHRNSNAQFKKLYNDTFKGVCSDGAAIAADIGKTVGLTTKYIGSMEMDHAWCVVKAIDENGNPYWHGIYTTSYGFSLTTGLPNAKEANGYKENTLRKYLHAPCYMEIVSKKVKRNTNPTTPTPVQATPSTPSAVTGASVKGACPGCKLPNRHARNNPYVSALNQTFINGYAIFQHDGNGYLQWFDRNGKEYFDTNGNGSIADEIAALPPATYNY